MNQKLFTKDFTLVVIGQIISLFGNAAVRFALLLYRRLYISDQNSHCKGSLRIGDIQSAAVLFHHFPNICQAQAVCV